MSAEEQRGNKGYRPGGVTGKGWKPGQSGNPGGRPKGSGVTAALRRLLRELHNGKAIEDLVAERWLKEALSGKPVHLQMLLDRTEGRVTEKHELSGDAGVVRILVADARGNERECASLGEFYRTTAPPAPGLPPAGPGGGRDDL